MLRLSDAAKAVGRARSTIHRDIARGKLSVTRSGTGVPYIAIAELERAYGRVARATLSEPVALGHDATTDAVAVQRELVLLREERERERQQLQTVIDDLRHQLGEERADRRRAQEQLGEALSQVRALTDQRPAAPPPRRSLWPWRR